MKKDEPGKTKAFIKKGIILWIIVIAIYLMLNLWIDNSGFLGQFNGVIFIFGVVCIPLILVLSVLLKLAQKGIDKIGDKYKKNEHKKRKTLTKTRLHQRKMGGRN